MDTCRLDIDACHELCVLAIESAVHDPWGEPVSCDVTFFTSSVALDAHYQVATGHNCPVPRTDSP
jgi:hypothetical protein